MDGWMVARPAEGNTVQITDISTREEQYGSTDVHIFQMVNAYKQAQLILGLISFYLKM